MRAKTWVSAVSASALLTTAVVFGGGTLSNANAAGPTAQPAGTLTLATGNGPWTSAGDQWTYDNNTPADTSDDVTQSVSSAAPTSCYLAPVTGNLVTLSASGVAGSQPGYAVMADGWKTPTYSHAIGVTQSATVSSSCSRVNITKVGTGTTSTKVPEALTVALNGSALASSVFGPMQASATSLDVSAQDDSKVTATLSLHGAAVGSFFLVADEDTFTGTPAPNTTYCKTSEAEGGDDWFGTRGSCTWNISGVNFDSITLTPTQGWFSLQGGGEWGPSAASHRTTFSLVSFYDGTLSACDGTESATTFGSGTVTGATLTRLVSGTATQCNPLPYTLSGDSGTTTFHKPTLSGDTSQFAIEVDGLQPAPTNPPAPLQVDWEDATGAHNLGYCAAGSITAIGPAPSYLPTVDYGVVSAQPDQSAVKAGQQYACVYKQSSTLNPDGSLSTADWVYFTGDVVFRNP